MGWVTGVGISSALAYGHGLSIDEKAMCFVSVAHFHTLLPFLLYSLPLERCSSPFLFRWPMNMLWLGTFSMVNTRNLYYGQADITIWTGLKRRLALLNAPKEPCFGHSRILLNFITTVRSISRSWGLSGKNPEPIRAVKRNLTENQFPKIDCSTRTFRQLSHVLFLYKGCLIRRVLYHHKWYMLHSRIWLWPFEERL